MTDNALTPRFILAQTYVQRAIDQLHTALEMPEVRRLQPKHRRLIRVTHTNLRRYTKILAALVSVTEQTIDMQTMFPNFLLSPQQPDKMPAKSYSPHNPPLDHSD